MGIRMKSMKLTLVVLAAGLLAGLALVQPPARGDEVPEQYRTTIDKGLAYLVKQQFKDGHWGANGDQYPVSMTGLGGLALLMEGSTVRDGKYSKQIRAAVDWLMDRSMKGNNRDGLVGNPDHPTEAGRYMYGHGFGTLFLACAYGEEDDKERRERLKDILTRACKYIANAQSTQGGWFYTSAKDGHDQDEGSVTITQMQALRACKNAGIPVNKEVVRKGYDYLKKSTTQRGGVVYSLGRGGFGAPVGGERPALTAAAIACLFSAGEYKDELVKKWFRFCQTAIPISGAAQHDEYTHFYYAQSVYILGDDGWERFFGSTPPDQRVTWTAYRKNLFDRLKQTQNADGSWSGGGGFSVGPVYSTAIWTIVMQLDKGSLPIWQR
jgi:hypothetical protein